LKREYIHPEDYKIEIERSYEFAKKTLESVTIFKKIHYSKVSERDIANLINEFKLAGGDSGFVGHCEHIFNEYKNANYDEKEAKKAIGKIRKGLIELYQKHFDLNSILKQKEFAKVYEQFQAALKDNMKYDYDDMIVYVVDAFKADPDLLNEYQELYQYILLDEYQDTNAAQNEAVFLLGSYFPNPNIFVVGDDDQSIYKFQGANTQNIFAFREKYEEYLKIITLTNNYRSHQLILDAAASVIENNSTRLTTLIDGIDKRLKAQASIEKRPLEIDEYRTREEEMYHMTQVIKDLLMQKVPPQEVAILCRDNKSIDDLKTFFAKAGISAAREQGDDITESVFIRQLISLIRYLSKPEESFDLFTTLNSQFLGICSQDLIRLNLFAYRSNANLSELILEPGDRLAALGLQNMEKIQTFVSKLVDWRQRLFNSDAIVFFNELINESGYLEFILACPEKVSEIGKLNRLYQELKDIVGKNKDYTLMDFISDLDLYQEYNISLLDTYSALTQSRVKLSTVHGAKGLEFDYVFLFDCADKKWSNTASREKIRMPIALTGGGYAAADNDEERRLFYVALTRARKHVTISYHINSETGKTQKQPAEFIGEIDAKFTIKKQHTDPQELTDAMTFTLANTKKLDLNDESKAMLAEIISKMRFSITHINSYLKCPRCFFLKTILRIPQLKSASLALGTAIHETMKYAQNELNETGQIPSIDLLISKYEEKISNEYLATNDRSDALDKGKKLILNYFPENMQSLVKGDVTEKNMGVYGVNWEGIPLAGKIDLIHFIDDLKKNVSVIDFKTGNPDNRSAELSQKGLGDYYRQLLFYRLLVENVPSLDWHVIKGKIVFLEKSHKTHEFMENEFDLATEDYDKLKLLVKDVYKKISDFEFDECGNKCDNQGLHEIYFDF
jgi:DNA helicase-2/ATP-dependent DNA helicase PcrA